MVDDKDSMQTKILQELRKTGFPTEIICASVMQKCGWGVLHNPSYWDDSEKVSREFDIRAYKKWKYITPLGDHFISVYLISECKKSEKPWVFFSTPETHYPGLSKFIKTPDTFIFSSSHPEGQISDTILTETHHYFKNSKLARTFYEPFKGQEKSDTSQMIYSAIMSSVKATLFHSQDRRSDEYTNIYYPIIIFNGNMYEAQVKSPNDIELVPSEYIQLSFNYVLPKSSEYNTIWERQERFIIDVIRYDYLEKYLDLIECEHAKMAEYIQNSYIDDSK